jgi:hypothetical protein
MPRRTKGPRLWLQPARKGIGGRTLERAVWVIRDGSIKRSTGAGQSEIAKAERAPAAYLSQRSLRACGTPIQLTLRLQAWSPFTLRMWPLTTLGHGRQLPGSAESATILAQKS